MAESVGGISKGQFWFWTNAVGVVSAALSVFLVVSGLIPEWAVAAVAASPMVLVMGKLEHRRKGGEPVSLVAVLRCILQASLATAAALGLVLGLIFLENDVLRLALGTATIMLVAMGIGYASKWLPPNT